MPTRLKGFSFLQILYCLQSKGEGCTEGPGMPVPGRHGGEGGVDCGAEAEPGQPSAEQGAAATKETGIPIIFDRDKYTIYTS